MFTIFYEDQKSQRNEFGLHRFVCQLVIDRAGLPQSVYEIERSMIQGIPLKGNGNVFKRCKKDPSCVAVVDWTLIAAFHAIKHDCYTRAFFCT